MPFSIIVVSRSAHEPGECVVRKLKRFCDLDAVSTQAYQVCAQSMIESAFRLFLGGILDFLTPQSATLLFIVACLAGYLYRRAWGRDGAVWWLWGAGFVSGAAFLILALVPLSV